MIVRKHDSHGHWAMDDATGEVLTKPVPTDADLTEVLKLVALARLLQLAERLGVMED